MNCFLCTHHTRGNPNPPPLKGSRVSVYCEYSKVPRLVCGSCNPTTIDPKAEAPEWCPLSTKVVYKSKPLTEDPETGELILEFPDELIEKLGWLEGDTLQFNKEPKGGISVINKSKEARETMSLFLVETIQTFKHQYLVRAQSAEHAQDTVVCQEAPEVSQKHLDETIISCRAVTQDEALNVHKGEDQRTLTNYWLPLETVIHTVKY